LRAQQSNGKLEVAARFGGHSGVSLRMRRPIDCRRRDMRPDCSAQRQKEWHRRKHIILVG
jgi:hypothetical protein